MTHINIRRAIEEDYSRLIEIEKASFDSNLIALEDLYGYDPFLLEVNNIIVGFYISYYLEEDLSYYLETIEIDPNYRSNGYSKLLLNHYIKNSKGPCSLHCHIDNSIALALYTSNGFHIIGMEDNFYDEGESAYFLRRSLNEDQNKSDIRQYV